MQKHTNYKYDLNGNKLGKYDGWSCISTISQQNKDITKTDWYVFVSNFDMLLTVIVKIVL